MTASTRTDAKEFVEFFAAGWQLGARDADGFFRHFGPRMHPDTVLIQPIASLARGPGGCSARCSNPCPTSTAN